MVARKINIIKSACVLLFVFLSGLFSVAVATPLLGQIIVDPDNPAWFKYTHGQPFFLAAPGDPEDFLFRGVRNPDGTRTGDQEAIIDKLKTSGANGIYLQTIRSHGGDGEADHNPFVDSDPTRGLDENILAQWEEWFTLMDRHGIVIYFLFYDDESKVWDTGDIVGPEENLFFTTLVHRFKKFRHLIWVIAEEYSETLSPLRASRLAGLIRDADDHDHPIAIHKLNGLKFNEFAYDPHIDQFAIQYNVDSAGLLHQGVVSAWNLAAGRYNLNMAEAADHGTGAIARQKNWAVAMAGAYVMVLGMDVVNTSLSDLNDLGRLRKFMESTDFNIMAPHDELAHSTTQYVLASPGNSYIAYSSNLTDGRKLGIKDMQAGTYYMRWFDTVTGATFIEEMVSVVAGDNEWSKPAGFSNEVVLYIYSVIFRNGFENHLGRDDFLFGERTSDAPSDFVFGSCG